MYLRFVTTQIDPDSRRQEGIFTSAYELLYRGDIDKDEARRLRALLDWFEEHLEAPPKAFKAGRAIFWFKASANECVEAMWELFHLVRAHGFHVEVHKCRHLQNICWHDTMQVAAYPSDQDGKVTTQ